MNRNLHFELYSIEGELEHITLYIQTIYDYQINGQEGLLEFDGYLYYNLGNEEQYNRTLNQALFFVHEYTAEGIQDPVHPNTVHYEHISSNMYKITFIKREWVKNTNSYSTIEEPDGSELDVCFFPTDRQRLYFRIIDTFQSTEEITEIKKK